MAFSGVKAAIVAVTALAAVAAYMTIPYFLAGQAPSTAVAIYAGNEAQRDALRDCLSKPEPDEVVVVDGVRFHLYFPSRHGGGKEAVLDHTPTGAMTACLSETVPGVEPLTQAEQDGLKAYFTHVQRDLGHGEVRFTLIPNLRAVLVTAPMGGGYDEVIEWVIGNITGDDPSIAVAVKRVSWDVEASATMGGELYKHSFWRLREEGIPVVEGAFASFSSFTGRAEVTIGLSDPSEEDVMKALRILAENPAVKEVGVLDVVFMEVIIGT